MAKVFKRKYSLVIGRPQQTLINTNSSLFQLEKQIFSNPTNIDALISINPSTVTSSDYITIDPAKRIEITDLDIKAKIGEKKNGTATSQPNVGSITVINPSPSTQAFVKSSDLILLRAGYETDEVLPLIFVGQIESTVVVKVGENTEMKISLGDASNTKNNVMFAKTWPTGTKYETVLRDVANAYKANGVPLGRFVRSLQTERVVKVGITEEGLLSKVLEKLCKNIGYTNYTSLGKLYIEPKQFNSTEVIIPSTKIAQITEDVVKGGIRAISENKSDKSNTDVGILVRTFLTGSVQLATTAKVTYGLFEGDYKITNLQHELDFRGDKWDTIIECQKIEF